MEVFNIHGMQPFSFRKNDIGWDYIHVSQEDSAFDVDFVYLQLLVFNTYTENINLSSFDFVVIHAFVVTRDYVW